MGEWRRMWVVLTALLVLVGGGVAGAEEKQPPIDKAVAMTNSGEVIGHIYDAATSLPLPGAQVTIQQQGAFAAEGPTTSTTNELGLYRCRAPLGRISTSYNVAGLLLGRLAGPGSTRTQRVDVTQLPVRATAPGYRTFEGVVRCRATNAAAFSVGMEPILLTAKEAPEAPTAADGWGALKLLELTVEPRILRPKEKAKVTARVQAPAAAAVKQKTSFLAALFGKGKKAALRLEMWSSLSGRRQGMELVSSEGGVATFTGEFGAPREARSPSVMIYVTVAESPLEVLAGTQTKWALIQVLPKGAAEAGARLRLEAASLSEAGETVESQKKLTEVCALPEVTIDDCLWLARTSDRLHDTGRQVTATKQALSLLPKNRKTVMVDGQEMKLEAARWRLMGEYARALVANGQPADVLSEVRPEVEKVKEKDRPKTVPGPVVIAIGRAYLDSGNLTQAAALRDSLHEYPQALGVPEAGEFARKLRLAEAEHEMRAAPESGSAWAGYGRALLDQGRWEEAATALQTALQKDPGARAVRRDLTYTLLHLQGQAPTVEASLDDSIVAARQQLGLEKGQTRSRNFHDWHAYAMLLYRKACQQQQAKDAGAEATLLQAREAVIEAVKNGRQGADSREQTSYGMAGGYLFATSSRTINIAGFAYPEAAADFVLLECLDGLRAHPEDAIGWHTLSTALLDLEQTDAAARALGECRRLRPDYPEATFTRALLALQQKRGAEARQALQETLKVNPRHPRANKLLAQLCAEDGDMVSSAACLAAHAQFYGETE